MQLLLSEVFNRKGTVTNTADRTSVARNQATTSSSRSIVASIMGNVIEWYDFALFACLAPVLADLFFPNTNYINSLLSAFLVFAVGFISRPVGSIIFGHLGDRLGRAKTLKLTIFLISLPALSMAFLPTYQQIGIYAPILLVVLRLLQGLCIGGEFAGAMIYLAETSPNNKRAFLVA
jgi:MHS family proline/betaine transporter-like MFS transporter